MVVKSYKDLLVWQKSMDLVEEIYKVTSAFPRNEEFGLKSQMRRAAVSIPSNIAEGQGRHHRKVFLEFLFIALGSLFELRTQIELTIRLKILSESECEQTRCLCDEVGKMLHGLVSSIQHSHARPPSTNH
jgi:four helix bundle protein